MHLNLDTKHFVTAIFWLSGFALAVHGAHPPDLKPIHYTGIEMLKDCDDVGPTRVLRDLQPTALYQDHCLAPRDTLLVCEGDTISILQNTGSPENCAFKWEDEEDLLFEEEDSLFMHPKWIAAQSRMFTVVVSDSIQSDSGFILVNVIPLPKVDLPDSLVVCKMDSCALVLTEPAYSYSWTPMEGVMSTSDSLVFALCPSASTLYTVSIAERGCTSTDSIFVEVMNPDTICILDNLALSSQLTYLNDTCHFVIDYNADELAEMCMIDPELTGWAMILQGDTLAQGQGPTFTGSFLSDPCIDTIAQVLIILNDQTDCFPIPIYRELKIQKSPSIELISTTICKNDTSDFLVKDPSSCWNYRWAPITGLFFPDPTDSSIVRALPATSTTYKVTVSNDLSSVIDSVNVEVRDSVNVGLKIVQVLCDGRASLLATSQNQHGLTPLQWSYNPEFEPAFSVTSGDTFTVLSERDTIDVYLRAVMNADTSLFCGSNVAKLRFTDASFVLDVNTLALDSCFSDLGMAEVYFVGTGIPVDSILWSTDFSANLVDSTDLMANPIRLQRLPGQSGIVLQYQTTYTRRCNQSGTVVIPTTGHLEIDLELASNFCGDTVVVKSVSNYPDATFEWSLEANFESVLYDSSVDQVTLTIDTVTTVYMRATANSCSEVTSRTIRPREKVQLISTAPDRICIGDTATIIITPKEGESLLTTWVSNSLILSTTDTSVMLVATEGLENLEVSYWTQSINCPNVRCDSLISIPIGTPVAPNPVFEAIPCSYKAQLMANAFYPDLSLKWTAIGSGMTLYESSPIIDFGSPGVFLVLLEPGPGLESCRFLPDTLEVILPEYVQLTADQDTHQVLCPRPIVPADSVVILSVTINLPEIPIFWTDQEGNAIGQGDSLSINVRSGLTRVTAITGEDASGCADTVSFNLIPYRCSPVVMGNVGPFCANQEIMTVSASMACDDGSVPEVIYAWTSENAVISNEATANPIFVAGSDFSVVLSITDLTNNCLLDTVILVEVEDQPDVNISALPGEKILIGQTVTLSAETDGPTPISFAWSTGETIPSIDVSSPLGINNFAVTVTDGNNCIGVDIINIDVQDCLTGIPTAFSPNRDDINETFTVRSNCPLEDFELKIINRWGEEVFFTADQDRGWDGKMNGEELSPDAYAYFIQFRCPNQTQTQTFVGKVSLLR